jgi:hypothetical protein
MADCCQKDCEKMQVAISKVIVTVLDLTFYVPCTILLNIFCESVNL